MSLHKELGKDAPAVLQGMMKAQVELPEGFEVEDNGNHYVVRKGGEEMSVPLFAAKNVFQALAVFVA